MFTAEHFCDGTATMAASENKILSQRADNDRIISLHGMFRIVGDQMSQMDVSVLKFLYRGVFSEELMSSIHDGYSFLLALEKTRVVDDSNFHHLLHLLRMITRHDLTQYVTLRRRQPATSDPVAEYLERTSKSRIIVPFQKRSTSQRQTEAACSQPEGDKVTCSDSLSPHRGDSSPGDDSDSVLGEPAAKKHKHDTDHRTEDVVRDHMTRDTTKEELKKKVTCDIRLRVRAEYCHHDAALEGNVHSNKPDLIERQFEKFMQANTILKSRDLGSIMCDIKFSELTYLDAFWRDYINGSLLEALKGVFITESLKQAVGHEAIKLLVNVDEDDYETGRVKLLQNLSD